MTNKTTPTPVPFETNAYKILFWSFLGLETLFICLGNSFLSWLIVSRKRLRSKPNYLVLSLSVSDLLIGLSVPPCEICTTYSTNYPNNCAYICGTIVSFNMLASVLNLLLIAADRYFSIMKPFAYSKYVTRRRLCVIIAFTWLFTLVCALIPFTWILNSALTGDEQLYVNTVYSFTMFSLIILVGAFLGWVYCTIGCVVGRKISRGSSSRTSTKSSYARSKGIRVCLLVSISYFVCWVPFFVVEMLLQSQATVSSLAIHLAQLILLFNPVLDPLVYAYYRKDFRKEIRRLFGGNSRAERESRYMSTTEECSMIQQNNNNGRSGSLCKNGAFLRKQDSFFNSPDHCKKFYRVNSHLTCL